MAVFKAVRCWVRRGVLTHWRSKSTHAKSSSSQPKWNYQEFGPSQWSKTYPVAGGANQSPIDLKNATTTEPPGGLTLQRYESSVCKNALVKNLGSTVSFLNLSGDLAMTGVHGVPEKTYLMDHFHFHFGSDTCEGGEHAFDGKLFPMEIHLVHYAKSFGAVPDAATKKDGLAVLGFMYEISEEDNPHYTPLVDALERVQFQGETHQMAETSFTIRSLLPESLSKGYFWYQGSLTTPPCYETVLWTVFKDTIKISKKQLEKFQSLRCCPAGGDSCCVGSGYEPPSLDGTHMKDNYRPLQPVNDRVIYESNTIHIT